VCFYLALPFAGDISDTSCMIFLDGVDMIIAGTRSESGRSVAGWFANSLLNIVL